MSRRSGPWAVLGIDQTDDLKAIRKAYADKLRGMDLDRDAVKYAALRDARDRALYWAKAQAAPVEDAGDEWSLAGVPADDDGTLAPIAATQDQPAHVPADPSSGHQPVPTEEELAQLPDRRLDRLLFPGGEVSNDPFSDEEGEQAQAAMRELIVAMLDGELTRQRMGEYWMADRLASAWPRSAPLLEEASQAFEWEKQRGQLGEGPAQAFLNARLRGLRFYDAVRQPGHWAHRAWNELSKPGDKGAFARLRASKGDVQRLLTGIRENFPEIESYLDDDRVASWEQTLDNPWKVSGGLIFVVIFAFQLLRLCSSPIPEAAPPIPSTFESAAPEPARDHWTLDDREKIVVELFGPGTTFDAIQLDSPFLAEFLRQRMPLGGYRGDWRPAEQLIIERLRNLIFLSAQHAHFGDLVAIKQFKLELVRLAHSEGGISACATMLGSISLPANITVPESIRQDERKLAKRLLAAGRFAVEPGALPATSAQIPGEMFATAERASGVSGSAATEAAGDRGGDRNRCLFRKALLAEVLKKPGQASADLLQTL